MKKQALVSLEEHFSQLDDPRGANIEHMLFDIVVIAILATICGADGWVAIEQFGHRKEGWLREYLILPNGIPSHDTFGRVFSLLNPEDFQACFMKWVKALNKITQGQVIGLDGKQMRGSHDKSTGKRALYMVSAWAEANHLVLGQRKVADKSNEITAIPELLQLLEIKGCIVTVDAIGTQTKIAKMIADAGADYLLPVKNNHGKLYQDLEMLFTDDPKYGFQKDMHDYAKETTKGHGRIDVRECWTIADPEYLAVLRHMAINLLKKETLAKGGIKIKRIQAGWFDDYLLKVLSAA